MRSLRALYHLARADFLQRTRSYAFLITLAVTLYVAYFFIPPNHSSYATMQIGGHRGLYNSAYLGALMALLISPFLSLAGFYLVKNAIDRDIQTRVGQILATTPLSKPLYTLGKTLSNFAVLGVMVAIMGAATGVMQFARKEDLTLQIGPLIAPLVFISLPVMFVVASLAILFEAIPWLRGGLGNVVYFVLWATLLGSPVARVNNAENRTYYDLFGIGAVVPSISAACDAAFPGAAKKEMSMGINIKSEGYWDLSTFRWKGLDWTKEIILSRFAWMGVGLALALLAAVFFRRFDPAREGSKRAPKVTAQQPVQSESEGVSGPLPAATLHPLRKPLRFSFIFMVVSELRLALHGISLWWYLVTVGLIAASLFTPVAVSSGLLVATWIWPLLIWSAMGTREKRWRTDQLVFSNPYPLFRQLPACWLAGIIVAILAGSGTAVRLFIAGEQLGLLAWMTGAVFIPTMALAFGVWSGSGKLFEVMYLLLWYLGPANRTPDLDFMGVTGHSLPWRTPLLFAAITAALAIWAVAGRKRQLSN